MIKDYKRFAVSVLIIVLAGFGLFMAAERMGICINEEGRDTDEFGMKCGESMDSISGILLLLMQLLVFPAAGYFIGVYYYFGGTRPQPVDFIIQLGLLTGASAFFELFLDTAIFRLALKGPVEYADIPMAAYLLALAITFFIWLVKNAISAVLGGVAAYAAGRK